MKLLITGATGKVGSNLIRRLSLSPRPDLIIRALCHNRALPAAPGLEVVKGTISDRDSVERAMDGRHPCRPSRDLQGNSRTRHGRDGQGPVLVDRGVPRKSDGEAIHPDRRRRQRRSFLLRPWRAGDGGDAAQGLSGLLCAVESAGGDAASADAYPVRAQCLMPARALDHGEGRLSLLAVVRR